MPDKTRKLSESEGLLADVVVRPGGLDHATRMTLRYPATALDGDFRRVNQESRRGVLLCAWCGRKLLEQQYLQFPLATCGTHKYNSDAHVNRFY